MAHHTLIRSIVSDRACRWGSWTPNGVIDTMIDEHGINEDEARSAVAMWVRGIDAMDFLGTCAARLR